MPTLAICRMTSHSRGVTGVTDRRPMRNSAIPANSGVRPGDPFQLGNCVFPTVASKPKAGGRQIEVAPE